MPLILDAENTLERTCMRLRVRWVPTAVYSCELLPRPGMSMVVIPPIFRAAVHPGLFLFDRVVIEHASVRTDHR